MNENIDGDELFNRLVNRYNIPERQILTRQHLANLPRNRPESRIPSLDQLFDENRVLPNTPEKRKRKPKTDKMAGLEAGFAMKLIPEYSGKTEELHKFLNLCNEIHATAKVNEVNKFLSIVKSKLVGRAYDEVVKFKKYEDWNSMKKALESTFSETRSVANIQSELFGISQFRNEEMRTYATRVQRLLTQLDNACLVSEGEENSKILQISNEKLAINAFQNGIHNEGIKLYVKACRCTTLKDSIDVASEESLNSKSKINSSHNDSRSLVRCQICKKLGHTSNACYQRYSSKPNFHTKPNSSTYTPNKVQQLRQICNYCKKAGHLISECRKRLYNNSISETQNQNKPSENKSGLDQSKTPKTISPTVNAPVRALDLK